MEAKILKRTEESIYIGWEGPTGFGRLEIRYDGKGGYYCDAEHIGFETLFAIIKAVDL